MEEQPLLLTTDIYISDALQESRNVNISGLASPLMSHRLDHGTGFWILPFCFPQGVSQSYMLTY